MVQTRKMAIQRQESSSGSDMAISPRINTTPTLTNTAHNQAAETNIVALQPYIPAEPTLLEITEPDTTFEALPSQLEPTCEIKQLNFN